MLKSNFSTLSVIHDSWLFLIAWIKNIFVYRLISEKVKYYIYLIQKKIRPSERVCEWVWTHLQII